MRGSLERAARQRPDFGSAVGAIELTLLEAVAGGRLAEGARELVAAFAALRERVPTREMWASVHDRARFTLEPYAAIAGSVERAAARTLLKALAAMARAGRP